MKQQASFLIALHMIQRLEKIFDILFFKPETFSVSDVFEKFESEFEIFPYQCCPLLSSILQRNFIEAAIYLYAVKQRRIVDKTTGSLMRRGIKPLGSVNL